MRSVRNDVPRSNPNCCSVWVRSSPTARDGRLMLPPERVIDAPGQIERHCTQINGQVPIFLMVFHIANKGHIAAKEEWNEFLNITQFVAQNGRYLLVLQLEDFLNCFVQMLQGGGSFICQAK